MHLPPTGPARHPAPRGYSMGQQAEEQRGSLSHRAKDCIGRCIQQEEGALEVDGYDRTPPNLWLLEVKDGGMEITGATQSGGGRWYVLLTRVTIATIDKLSTNAPNHQEWNWCLSVTTNKPLSLVGAKRRNVLIRVRKRKTTDMFPAVIVSYQLGSCSVFHSTVLHCS